MLGRIWGAIKNLFGLKTVVAAAVVATVVNPIVAKKEEPEVPHRVHKASDVKFEDVPDIQHPIKNIHESHGRNGHLGVHFSKENRPKDKYIINDTMINEINSKGQWVAKRNDIFEGKTIQDVLHLFGVRLIHKKTLDNNPNADIPTSFDGRDAWGSCVHGIRNQGHCGSCWAFAATEVLSDRFCIHGHDVILAPQDLVSCDSTEMGCEGGYLENSWIFMCNHGVCSEDCWPYSSGTGMVERCRDTCSSGIPKKEYKCIPSSIKSFTSVSQIQQDIMENGPVEAGFEVYQDFMNYGSGVYSHHSGSVLGGHAIKIIGWGVDPNGVPYWICANSWGTTWGNLGGFFLIKRGVDECSIESNVISGLPVISGSRDPEITGPTECLMCKFLTAEIEKLISSGKTEQEIIQAMEKVCDKLGKFKDACDYVVETYLPILIKLLLEKETPEVVCKQIGLCV